jgi:hypothetical protein
MFIQRLGAFCRRRLTPEPRPMPEILEQTQVIISLKNVTFVNIVELLSLNIEARYPEYKGKVSKFMTDSKTKEILDKTINLQQWMKKQLL